MSEGVVLSSLQKYSDLGYSLNWLQYIRLLLSYIPEEELKIIIEKSLLVDCKQMIWLQNRTERFPKKVEG